MTVTPTPRCCPWQGAEPFHMDSSERPHSQEEFHMRRAQISEQTDKAWPSGCTWQESWAERRLGRVHRGSKGSFCTPRRGQAGSGPSEVHVPANPGNQISSPGSVLSQLYHQRSCEPHQLPEAALTTLLCTIPTTLHLGDPVIPFHG